MTLAVENFNKCMEDKKQYFLENTFDPDIFKIEDVENDNACFYRAVSNVINYSCPSDKISSLKKLDNYGCYKNIEQVLQNEDWGYSSDNQDKLSKYFQKKSYNWIKNNFHIYLEEYGMNLETMCQITHEIDIKEYIDRYKYFAGDKIITKHDSGKVYKSGGKKGQPIITEIELEDRWGSTLEQIALSEIFKVSIIILSPQNLLHNKIITGKITNNKAEKGVRFKVMQIIGKSYLLEKHPIFILWKKQKNEGHYIALYLKEFHDSIEGKSLQYIYKQLFPKRQSLKDYIDSTKIV